VTWSIHPAAGTFERYRERWDALNRASGNHVLLDAGFVARLLAHFGHPGVKLAVSEDPARPGLVLLEPGRRGFWSTFQPSQAPMGLVLLGSRQDVPAQMQRLIRALPGHALGLAVLQQDPDFTCFGDLGAGVADPRIEILEYIRTARLTLDGSFDDYWGSRDRRWARDLARQRRRLHERGARLELEVSRDPREVAEGVRDYGRLEQAGWKGEGGTAIAPDNAQGAFYRDALEHFCARGEGVIYRLRLDGRTVAANLSIERDAMLIVLKITYDETIAGLSPGHLLEEDMLRAVFRERRIKVEEYYGPFKTWQARWTDEVRTMHHVNFYRSAGVARARRLLKAVSARLRRASGPRAAEESRA
jgi:CelD/BcsL family acetyltransferase involved in cellulose biosynthesis